MTVALYRRYRPETFADVIGQEHVTDPLRQALRTGRIGHAYLFSGPRGCGKTTSARILARCLNCERGPTDEPCGECPSCVALARGGPGSVDVIEIDAASHGGVEDARDLREKASYGPAQSRYKVYIIDEAHMVTPQGFNALLKIVEEPPEHVKFVFATTEPEKVIGTIRSRTHHYPFRLVPPQRLTEYLEQICAAEQVPVAPGVLSFVVRAGGGSVRDSLSVLDQLMAGSGPEGLTYDAAAALLGFTPEELLDATVEALAAADGGAVFRQIDRVVETGQDPRRFVEDLLERFRDLIVISAIGGDPQATAAVLRGIPEDQLARMRQQATTFGPGQLSHAADTINAGLTEMTGATSPRLHLELICARLLLPGASGERGYAARLDRLERRLEVAGAPPPVAPSPAAPPPVAPSPAAPSLVAPTPPAAATPPDPPSPGVAAAPPDESFRPGPAGASAPEPSSGDWATQDERPGRRPAARTPAPVPATAASPTGHPPTGQPPTGQPPTGQPPGGQPAGRSPVGGMDTDALRRSWPDVLAKIFTIRRVTWTFLSEHAQVLEYDGRRLVLGIATVGLATTFRQGLHAEVVRQALIDTLGLDVQVEGVPYTPGADAGAGSGSGRGPARRESAAPGRRGDPRSAPGSPAAAGQPPGPGPAPHARAEREPAQAERPRAAVSPDGTGGGAAARRAGEHAGADVGDGPARRGRSPASGVPQSASPSAPPSSRSSAAPIPVPTSRAAAPTDDGPLPEPPEDPYDDPPPPEDDRHTPDASASIDDEDIDGLAQVGTPVIASVLGGTIIEDREE